MAATDAGLDHIADQTHRMATDMAKTEKSAEGLSDQFRQAALTFVGIDMIRHALMGIVQQTTTWQSLSQSLSKENLTQHGLLRRQMDLTNEANALERDKATATGVQGEFIEARLRAITTELGVLEKQKIVAAEMQRIGHATLGLLIVYKAAAIDLYLKTSQFNQNLIEANSAYAHRNQLLKETLRVQAETGMSFGEITKAASALVHYGLDTESTFNDNLRLIVQMEQGLGVSVNASAQLASIVERQLKGSFTDVSHVIAQIVNDTALAGDEAVRLANAISTALGRLRPGLGAQGLPEVVRLVGRYEAALKEVGGVPGAFQQLVTSLTTPSGIVGAGALGVSPEFLATSEGVQSVMDRFAQYGEMLVGQSQGWERQFRLQMLADVFGTSADSANQMLIAIQRANQQQMAGITVQERWRQQMSATNAGIGRLANSLLALLQGGLLPVVNAIGWIANRLADFVSWINRSRTAVTIVTTALGVGFFVLIGRMWGLVHSLWAVVTSATAAAAAQARLAAAQTAGAIAGGLGRGAGGFIPMTAFQVFLQNLTTWRAAGAAGTAATVGTRLAGWFPTVTSGLGALRVAFTAGLGILRTALMAALSPLGIIAGALLGAGWVLHKIYSINKQSREDNIAAQKIIISKQDALAAHTRTRIYAAARAGKSQEEVTAIYAALARQSTTMFGGDKAQQKAWLDEQMKGVELDALKAVATAGMFTPLKERTPEQAKHENDMRNISEKLLKVNEDQKAYLDKANKRDEENARDAEIDAAKNRSFFRDLWRGAKIAVGAD